MIEGAAASLPVWGSLSLKKHGGQREALKITLKTKPKKVSTI
jgi:hypothetical protein